jgi:TPR repeat protein
LFALQWISAVTSAAEPSVDSAALRNLARSFEHGEGVTKNPAEAIKLYCQAARDGDAEAMYRLGWMYAIGRGVQRDDTVAAYFFAKAAEQGHPQSKNLLPRMGDKIADTPQCMQDVKEAVEDTDDFVYTSETQRQWARLVERLAPEYGVSPRLALILARTESNLNPRAISIKNAQGLMQLIPETAVRFNVRKPLDAEQNVRGGLAYLRWLLAYFRGDVKLVVAAYNAGEGAVNKYLGIPPYPETRAYVARVLASYKNEAHPFDKLITDPSPEFSRIARRKARLGS